MLKNVFRYGAITIMVGLTAHFAARLLTSQTRKITPFTARKLDRIYHADRGELVRTFEKLYAVRSDGAHVDIVYSEGPDGQVREVKNVVDPDSRRTIGVDGHTQSISTTYFPPDMAAELKIPDAGCLSSAAAERKTILGYEVVKLERDLPAPAGRQKKWVKWAAPALNCYALEETFLDGPQGGPLRISNHSEVVFVEPGEPHPDLFTVPANFTERSPSQVMQEYYRRYPSAPRCAGCAGYQKVDEAYYAQQRRY
jgi:hypothetical protein